MSSGIPFYGKGSTPNYKAGEGARVNKCPRLWGFLWRKHRWADTWIEHLDYFDRPCLDCDMKQLEPIIYEGY